MKKLWPPEVEEVNKSKKQTNKRYKDRFPNTKKIRCMLLLKFKDDL